MKMKKLFAVCLLLAMPVSAFARIECDCGEPVCICFIQYGDEGMPVKAIVGFLAERGYLGEARDTFDRTVMEALEAFQRDEGLEQTGMCDDETLTRLIWGKGVAQMDAQDEGGGALAYVPTDGGKKRHAKPTCSGMHDPRRVSVRNAQAMGMDACARKGCWPR